MEKWELSRIADIAPTLKDLESLSLSKQSQLLLRRLATQYRSPEFTFGKMNFNLLANATDLAMGYPAHEILAVKDFLLGAPWKKLESEGLIRDNGGGWCNVTLAGFKAAQNAEAEFVSNEIISALALLHTDLQDYGHYFRENKLKEAVAAAFDNYENSLNQIRDASRQSAVKSVAGAGLVHKLFAEKVLKQPYAKLGHTPAAKAAYEQGLIGILSGGISWIRNA